MAKLSIDTKHPRFPVAPDLYGLFFEDINRAGDGGLYPEMLRNRSFEDSIPPEDCTMEENDFAFTNDSGWRDIFNHGEGLTRWIRDNHTAYTPIPAWYVEGGASIALNYKDTLNQKRRVSLDVCFGSGFVFNDGFAGVAIDAGKAYNFYMFAKNVEGSGVLSVSLEDRDGKVYDKKQFTLSRTGFVRYDAVFVGTEKRPDCRLVLRGDGKVRLGFMSLMPADTYNGHGLRTDIVEFYKGINPRFLRFPGGCVVEGFTYQTMQYFRNIVGPVWERPSHLLLWHYRTTNGLGFHEFMQLCEDIGVEPLYVCNAGIVCQGRSRDYLKGEALIDMLDDAIAAIEYATAPADTKYGAMRAAAGHPEPFGLKYIEIGNENGGPVYFERYKLFYETLKAKYPDMIFVANTHVENEGLETDIVDEHFYSDVNFFAEHLNHYDNYDRKGPGIFVGELAVNVGDNGKLRAAISEAMFFVGMERNQDIVRLASYAPLTQNVAYPAWFPNLVAFNHYITYGIPSYYIWKLFGKYRGSEVVPITEETSLVTRPAKGMPSMQGTYGLKFRNPTYNGAPIEPTHELLGYVEKDGDGWTTRKGDDTQAPARMLARFGMADQVAIVLGDDEETKGGVFEVEVLAEEGKTVAIGAYSSRGARSFFDDGEEREHKDWEYRFVHPYRWVIENGESRIFDARRALTDAVPVKLKMGEYNTLRYEADGEVLKVYLNGELVQQAHLPTRQKTAASATISESEVIVKIVNFSPDPEDVEITLDCPVEDGYTLAYLAGDGDAMNDENNPENVHDVVTACTGASEAFTFHAPANSANVLILKKK